MCAALLQRRCTCVSSLAISVLRPTRGQIITRPQMQRPSPEVHSDRGSHFRVCGWDRLGGKETGERPEL